METKDFSILPFRVVITDVLSYHLYRVNRNSSELELYGYFKADPTKKIFCIFSSLLVEKATSAIFDIRRIRYLELCHVDQTSSSTSDFVSKISQNSSKFLSLQCLVLDNLGKFEKSPLDLFFVHENSFPSLKAFGINMKNSKYYGDQVDIISEWHTNEKKWKKLEKLEICFPLIEVSRRISISKLQFGTQDVLISIRKLNLTCINFVGVVLNIPFLQHLTIYGCKGLEIVNEKKTLRYLKATYMRMDSLKNMFRNQTGLKKIEIIGFAFASSDHYVNIDWIFDKEVNDLPELVSIRLDRVRVSTKVEIPSRVQICQFRRFVGFTDRMWSELPKLRVLELDGKSMVCLERMVKFHFVMRLKSIRIGGIKKFNEDFFRVNHFFSLEDLIVSSVNITGVNWGNFQILKKLILTGTMKITDLFFAENKFPALERLEVSNINNDNLRGVGWGESTYIGRLKVLGIVNCPYFEDVLFQNVSFSELEGLVLNGENRVKGIRWKRMKNLKDLEISLNKTIGDGIFQQEGNFQKLETLIIFWCDNIRGVGWKFLPKLKRLEISVDDRHERQRFGDEFWNNKPFPDSRFISRENSLLC